MYPRSKDLFTDIQNKKNHNQFLFCVDSIERAHQFILHSYVLSPLPTWIAAQASEFQIIFFESAVLCEPCRSVQNQRDRQTLSQGPFINHVDPILESVRGRGYTLLWKKKCKLQNTYRNPDRFKEVEWEPVLPSDEITSTSTVLPNTVLQQVA